MNTQEMLDITDNEYLAWRDYCKRYQNEDIPMPEFCSFMAGRAVYRKNTNTAKSQVHNPDGLTEDQVDMKNGWRLLTEKEIESYSPPGGELQVWNKKDGGWFAFAMISDDLTYRTRL